MNSIRRLTQDIGDWTNRNFARPEKRGLGMVEEIGEYCEALVKMDQGVRKKNKQDIRDAIADCQIFCLCFCFHHDLELTRLEVDTFLYLETRNNKFHCLANILRGLSKVMEWVAEDGQDAEYLRGPLQLVMNNLGRLAFIHNINWWLNLNKIWSQVRQRDWIKWPGNGMDR